MPGRTSRSFHVLLTGKGQALDAVSTRTSVHHCRALSHPVWTVHRGHPASGDVRVCAEANNLHRSRAKAKAEEPGLGNA